MTETATPEQRQTPAAQVGGSNETLSDEQINAFAHEQLDAVDLNGRSLRLLVPDSTRSCPLPLLLSAIHHAVHGRVTRLTVLVALGTHPGPGAHQRGGIVGPRRAARAVRRDAIRESRRRAGGDHPRCSVPDPGGRAAG
jgi:hypothetical protein